MGIRVYFSRGARNGALDHFLSSPLEEFRVWYVNQYQDDFHSMIEADARLIPLIESVIERGAEAMIPATMEHAKLIDLMTCEFYFWCNWERSELLVETGNGEAKVHRYRNVMHLIEESCGEYAVCLWNYLLNGRPIGRSETLFPYTPLEKAYPNAYWTYDEAGFLYYRLLPYRDSFDYAFTREDGWAVRIVFRAVEEAYRDGIGLIIEVA